MSNQEPQIVWFEAEEYVEDITFEYNPDDGIVASFAYWRVRLDNHRAFESSEQIGLITAAMFFGPPTEDLDYEGEDCQ